MTSEENLFFTDDTKTSISLKFVIRFDISKRLKQNFTVRAVFYLFRYNIRMILNIIKIIRVI